MKYFKLLFTLIFSISISSGYCQSFSFEVNPGVGFFSMKDLKALVHYQNKNNIVPTQVIQNYPAFTVWDAKGLWQKKGYAIGIDCKFMSSGARLSYRDYSGELRLDHLAIGLALGACVQKQILQKNRFSLLLQGDVVLIKTIVDFESYLSVYEQSEKDELSTFSEGIGIEPAICLRYKLGRFSTGMNIGYMANANTNLHLPGKSNAELVNNENSSKVKPDWSGFRGGIHLAFIIK